MAKPLQFQILERARALIADEQHWCRGLLAQDATGASVFPTSAGAVKRCGLGAVIAAAYQLTHDFDAANGLAHRGLRPLRHHRSLRRHLLRIACRQLSRQAGLETGGHGDRAKRRTPARDASGQTPGAPVDQRVERWESRLPISLKSWTVYKLPGHGPHAMPFTWITRPR